MAERKTILELPNELLVIIFSFLIDLHGVEAAIRAERTCKAFNEEVRSAIWATKALQHTGLRIPFQSKRLLVEYLLARTSADLNECQYKLTPIIFKTIDYVRTIDASLSSCGYDLVREACSAIVGSHAKGYPRHQHPSIEVGRVLSNRQYPRSNSIPENALAFAAHLKRMSTVRYLIEEGARDNLTYFGSALDCFARQTDSNLLKEYLEARFRRTKQHGPLFVTDAGTLGEGVLVGNKVHKGFPKDISHNIYTRALRDAILWEVPKTVKILVQSIAEDIPSLCGVDDFYRHVDIPDGSTKSDQIRRWSSVLAYAVSMQRLDTVEFALEHGANPNACNYSSFRAGSTALEQAASNGDIGIFRLLLAHGADIHLAHRKENNLLQKAAQGGSLDIMNICLESQVGVNPSSRPALSDHTLVEAVHCNRPEVLRLLLDYGITFESGSELDDKLSEIATKVGSAQISSMLDRVREKPI